MIDFAVYTNTGSREINEDYVSSFSDEDRFCFVIADGLGGEGEGDLASRFVCNHTIALAEKIKKFDEKFLTECFTRIQKNLMRAKKELKMSSGMTSTLSILVFEGDKASWGHIGDSRIYCIADEQLKSITQDHSLAQFMISTGISEKMDVREHPDRSTLMAAMGMEDMKDAYEIDQVDYILGKDTWFVLCTDGFWQYVYEDELMNVLGCAESAADAIEKLVAVAKKNAGTDERDNISAIVIRRKSD